MRKVLPIAAAALLAPSLRAQSAFDAELRLAPQFIQYQIHAPSNERIDELAVPVFVTIPFGSRFTFDLGTAFARAHVTTGSAVSEISGLTDTQLRGNLTLLNDYVVVTGGVNLPSGRSSVTLDQLTAAGRIGSDFLAFPISNLGTGLALTGGIAVARPISGGWNLGFGASARRSSSYDPFDIPGQSLRFQPGNEYRGRVGVDHPFGAGRFSLGVTYSAFGDDAADTSVYNTGNRLITQGVITNTYNSVDVTVASYDVYRANGTYASGARAGRENILNGYLGLGLHVLGTVVEPSIEGRNWMQTVPANTASNATSLDRTQNSYLGTVSLRTRLEGSGISVYPSAGYTFGQLATLDASGAVAHADLTGYKFQLAVRVTP